MAASGSTSAADRSNSPPAILLGSLAQLISLPKSHKDFTERFEVIKEVGRGRFGEVLRCKQKADGSEFAVKRTGFGSSGQPDRDKVKVEAKALERLQHANVVRHFGSWLEEAHFCILMEFAEHGDFATLLASRWATLEAEGGKLLSEDEVMGYFVQLADGLAHVHSRRVVHRDLKPENIFVSALGKRPVLKLGDFGISRVLSLSMTELTKTVVGSPTYISPEIIHGASYSYKTDIWSLGVMLYRMASKKFPFDANNLAQLALKITAGSFPPLSPKYSPMLHHLVASMLQIDAEARASTEGIITAPIVNTHRTKAAEDAAAAAGGGGAAQSEARRHVTL